jgi:lysine 2,3-aminomutase
MKEQITPHLKKLLHHTEIAGQYVKTNGLDTAQYSDPLMEDDHEVVKGLVHKYDNRALVKVSYLCAAYCRFCTRIRQIGNPAGTLSEADIDGIAEYLSANPQIDDVILSGGDPLYTPQITTKLLQRLREIPSIKVLRIGSRLAMQSPVSIKSKSVMQLLDLVSEIGQEKPFYILLHINAPQEFTPETEEAISCLRKLNVTLLSQTVFLKGINDNLETLHELFKKIYHAGIMPYYIYHCDNVEGLENFAVEMDKERALVTNLYKKLSGIGCPRYVVDVPNGYGKIPVPLDFLNPETGEVYDFKGNRSIITGLAVGKNVLK